MPEHLDFSGEDMGPVPVQEFRVGHLIIPVPLTLSAYFELNSMAHKATGKTLEDIIAEKDQEHLGILHDIFQRIPAKSREGEEYTDTDRSIVPGIIIEDTEIEIYVFGPADEDPVLKLSFMLEPPNLA